MLWDLRMMRVNSSGHTLSIAFPGGGERVVGLSEIVWVELETMKKSAE
jgi:hypothetical protein